MIRLRKENDLIKLKPVNYDELVEMDLIQAKEIVSCFDENDWLEYATCKNDSGIYEVIIVDEGNWKDYEMHQHRTDIGLLFKIDKNAKITVYDIAVTQDIIRSGSYFSCYNYKFNPLQVNKVIQKVIPQQTVVTILE